MKKSEMVEKLKSKRNVCLVISLNDEDRFGLRCNDGGCFVRSGSTS